MKRSLLKAFLFYTFISLILAGCGGGGSGSPGSEGTEDTGVMVDASVTGSETYSVDAFQQVCDEGPPPVYEVFTDHLATLTITARLYNPNTTIKVGNLYVNSCTIKYVRSNDSIGAPPIEYEPIACLEYPIIITPPSGTGTTTITTSVKLVDLKRKEQYYNDILSGVFSYHSAYINNYMAVYTFKGINEHGKKFKFEAQAPFQIGSFDNCD